MALLGAGCTRCGQPYAAHDIRVLAQREGIAFVSLACFACQTQTLALVTGAPATDADGDGLGESVLGDLPAGDRHDDDGAAAGSDAAISELDVREMRAFLDDYHGDVSGLFEARDHGRGTDDDTGAAG